MKKISLRTNKRSCVTLDITASTRIFFNEIRKYPDSDAQQEPVEFSKIRAGDEKAREAMIASHMKYVVSVASFYLLPGLELNDLIQEGNHGLTKAIDRFDPTRGFKFISLATKYIQGYILIYISQYRRLLSFKDYAQKPILLKIEKMQDDFLKRYGYMPSSRQISSICGDIYDVFVDPRKIEQFLLYDQAHVSIGKGDVIDPNAYPQIVHAVQQEDRTTDILRVLSTLTNTEKEIIIDCYGIGREKTLSERDIATNRDLTSERVRQIKEKAIRRMKHPSRSAVLRKYLG